MCMTHDDGIRFDLDCMMNFGQERLSWHRLQGQLTSRGWETLYKMKELLRCVRLSNCMQGALRL